MWYAQVSRQLSPIRENSKVIYKLVLYFLGKFSCNKGLSHVNTTGLNVITKDQMSQGAREKDLKLEVNGCKHLLLRYPKFPNASCPKSGFVLRGKDKTS